MKAQKEKRSVSATSTKSDDIRKLLEQYGCGPVQFTGTHLDAIVSEAQEIVNHALKSFDSIRQQREAR